MAARTGMAALIMQLRTLAAASTDEYTLGATAFWTDEQLQDVLDAHRQTITEPLASHPEMDNQTRRYTFAARDVEQAASGADAWLVVDADGDAIEGADYTVNYAAREIVFAADTGGATYRLRCRVYALKRAAADVWDAKAAHVAGRFDIKTDNHELRRSQLRTSYLAMARQLRDEADAADADNAPRYVRIVREDVW